MASSADSAEGRERPDRRRPSRRRPRSISPKRRDRVDTAGLPRREIGRHEGCRTEHKRRRDEGDRVERFYPEQEAAEQAGDQQRKPQTDRTTDDHQTGPGLPTS